MSTGDDRVQDPYSFRCQPQVMGATLDLLANAARTLVIEANGVTDNPLVFAEDGAVLSGGNFHAEPVAFAADIIAMAIAEMGSISERRIAALIDPTISLLPPFLIRNPGLNSGFMIPQCTAAALMSENKQLAHPASVDSVPTSANQEDHVSMATHGARRLGADERQSGAHHRDRTDGCRRRHRFPPAADFVETAGGGPQADPRQSCRARDRPRIRHRHRSRGANDRDRRTSKVLCQVS